MYASIGACAPWNWQAAWGDCVCVCVHVVWSVCKMMLIRLTKGKENYAEISFLSLCSIGVKITWYEIILISFQNEI